MRRFGMIGSRVWRSKKFRDLGGTDSKLLYLYLHSCSHGNSAGCFHISPTLIAAETGIENVESCLQDLARVGLILRDPSEDLVQIRSFFAFNMPSSRKQLAGPLTILEGLPRGDLRDAVCAELALAVHEKATGFPKDHDAYGVFMHHAADLMKQGGIKAIETGLVEVDDDLRITLSETLLIGLSIQRKRKRPRNGKDHDHGEDHGEDQDHGEGVQGERGSIQDEIAALRKRAAQAKK